MIPVLKKHNHSLIQLLVLFAFAFLFACTPQEEQQIIKVESISIDQSDMTLVEGESTMLTAKVLPDDAEDKNIKWSSSDESKVMVTSSGKAVAMAIGQAIVSAQAGEAKDFITITVVAKAIAVTGISIIPTELTIKVGETGTLTSEITPQEATNKNVTWASSNDEVATVEDGVVTGIMPGSVTITVTTEDGGHKAECVVTVKSNLAPSVTIGAENISAVSAILKGKANLESTASSDLMVGFQYSKSAGILPSNSTTVEASEADSDYNYSVGITGLEPDTKYYFRSVVRQNGQDSFGETKEFTTKELSSLLHTKEATTVSAVSASLNADLDMADVQFKEKSVGFYWGDAAESLTNKVSASEGDGSISADISELAPSKQYYYQSFIILDGIELRESVLSFTTKDMQSLLETKDASGIEATSAVLRAKLDLTDVKFKSISYGFYCGDTENSLNNYLAGGEIIGKEYTASHTNLSHKTQYWYKAFLKLDSQTFYGEAKSFTTDVVKVESLSLDKSEYTFNTIGNTLTLTATILPADATDKSIEWSSDNKSVATVDQNGTVKAVGNGTATITVAANDGSGVKASCVITVAQWVTSITLDQSTLTLNEGQSANLSVSSIVPDNAADKTLKWTSSDGNIATVDQIGRVTAVSKGTAIIRAEANDGSGKYASCSVTVNRQVSSIVLSKSSIVIHNGETETLTATVTPSSANNTSVSWSSSNPSVATVSSTGLVTGKARGTTTITVTANDGSGVKATCEVEVKQYVTSITLDVSSLVLVEGQEQTLIAAVNPEDASDKTLKWTSSDVSVATVDVMGKVVAVSKGLAIIKAEADDYSGVFTSCAVTVIEPFGPVDLSLPSGLKWANYNLGADIPEGYGDYYAWGETETKENYSWETYKWCNGDYDKLTKYNSDSSYGTVDNKIVLDAEDDVAHEILGGKWRIPTDYEWTELRKNCTWTWVTDYNGTGINGMLVTGTNGNSIFLPAAGYWYGTQLLWLGAAGEYWSSSRMGNVGNQSVARIVYFHSSGESRSWDSRELGLSVRPVTD